MAGVERAAGSDDGQCIEQYGAGEAYLPLLEALDRLCRAPGGARARRALVTYAPSWVVRAARSAHAGGPGDLQSRTWAPRGRECCGRWLGGEGVEGRTTVGGGAGRSALERSGDRGAADIAGSAEGDGSIAGDGDVSSGGCGGARASGASVKDDLALRGLCRDLPLGRLSGADVGRYLAEALPGTRADGLVSRLHERTSGNPLFLVM